MKLLGKLFMICQFGLIANAANAMESRDVYMLNVNWVHSAVGSATNLQGADVKLFKNYANQTEVLGAVRVRIVGALAQDCIDMAAQSAAGNAQLNLFTDRGSAQFEIGDLPTYIIKSSEVRSCGLRKNK